jgi:hypothetical protein
MWPRHAVTSYRVIHEAQDDDATILRGYISDALEVACATTSAGQVIRSICDSTPSATNNETATNITDTDKDEETLQKRQPFQVNDLKHLKRQRRRPNNI